jgi:hypothetical protein
MERKDLTWTNLLAGWEWYGAPMDGYDVSFIPFNLVLDREGKLFALNPRAEQLEREVVRALSSPPAKAPGS